LDYKKNLYIMKEVIHKQSEASFGISSVKPLGSATVVLVI